ncbi:MAG: adenosylcobinamide-GDP ribazoletransferase [Nocardioides sp.]|nr:adenosylcobinamide-GDP ribazoletransferase [Nocardioides sp.]
MDSWRLALGTLTAIPTPPPGRVDRAVSRGAMLLGPLAVVPLGATVALILWVGRELGLAPLPVASVAVAALALGSRAFHLDGLSDTADGLTASYDRERSLEVMKSGSAGPAGVVAVVLVLGTQVGALASLGLDEHGWWLAGFLVCASRATLAIACTTGIPAARRDGLGSGPAGSVPLIVTSLVWLAILGISAGLFSLAGYDAWRGPVALLAGIAVVGLLLARCVSRFGGVTGDVFGTGIELSLAAMLLAAT